VHVFNQQLEFFLPNYSNTKQQTSAKTAQLLYPHRAADHDQNLIS